MSKLNKEIQKIISHGEPPRANVYDKIESICDDFADKFAEWVDERKVSFSRNGKIKTKKELLQEFKQHYNKD